MSIRGELPPDLWKQITLTFNPWSANSWLKSRFFDNPSELMYTLTTTYKCNEWLDKVDLQMYEDLRLHNPRRYRIEGEGEWGISEGLIYERVEMQDLDIEKLRKKPGLKEAYGLDFGFTDPTAFMCMLVDNKAMELFIFDEWYQTGATNKDIAAKIKAMGYGSKVIICDAAEPKSIQELRDMGIKAEPSAKGADSVLHGIQLLQNYRIIISSKCKEAYKEFSNYCWAKDKFGKPLDRPEHEFSHGPDACRYGSVKVLSTWFKPKPMRTNY